MTSRAAPRLAVDIGGTFTDTVILGPDDTVLASNKTLTTHENPADGAATGTARALAEAQLEIGQLGGFIHGTTLATNALIERRGAQVATITSDGFRDILEIGYERRYSQYDLNIEKPNLLVPRHRAFTVPERVSVNGEVLVALDEAALPELLAQLAACEAEAVAIGLMHAYANPDHEQRLRELLVAARPDLAVSISSEVSPEAREFDRLCTTVANAYIQPMMAQYLMMTAGGGMTTLETAARFPIRLVESGPAGGAILAGRIARQCGLDEVLSFDMGGTTAKLCLIDNGAPQTSRQFEIARAARFIKGSGMPVRIPVIEMIEIGAGGGSIAGVDRLGRLTVGPHSAGSEPGPVAFCRGGTAPTVTDADVTLGYIRSETFAEGQFALDVTGAADSVATVIGTPLQLDAQQAADGVSRIVDESMASAARMHAVESGKDLGERTMIAFGGNGPLHACRVARSAGVQRIVVPANPGVGSAVGFLYAPISYEIVRSRYALLDSIDWAEINHVFDDMIGEALRVVNQGLGQQGRAVTGSDAIVTTRRTAFMRYHGQGHEIEIALPDRNLNHDDNAALTKAFEADYARQFSRPVPGMAIEILNWSVRVSSHSGSDEPDDHATPVEGVDDVMQATCEIWCDVEGRLRQARQVSRSSLASGDRLSGPALVTEPQTTTFVAADFVLTVDPRGNLMLSRQSLEISS